MWNAVTAALNTRAATEASGKTLLPPRAQTAASYSAQIFSYRTQVRRICIVLNMNSVPINPRPMLQSLINESVIIRLKWGQTEYHGRLISVDSYMNVQLSNTEEFIDGKSTGTLGQVLIRCNNVLWISGAKGAKQEDVAMDG